MEAPALSLQAAPARIRALDNVTVSWSGIPFEEGDYIAMYCPPEAIPNDEVAFGSSLDAVAVPPPAAGADSGALVFARLVDMRCDYVFHYVKLDGPSWARTQLHVSVAVSNVVRVEPQPAQYLHLALTGAPGAMRAMWVANASASVPVVQWGLDAARMVNEAAGACATYGAADLCDRPANITLQPYFRDPGFFCSAVMTGLAPCTTYFYRVGDRDVDGALSPVHNFTTPPASGDGQDETRFFFFADWSIDAGFGAQATVARAVRDAQELGFGDFALFAGDASYAMGFAWLWEQWMTVIEPLTARVPLMVAAGNHEVDTPSQGFHPPWGNYGADSGGECGVSFSARFAMPDNGNGLFWYSFEAGAVHVTVMSTEHDFANGSAQYAWLAADLAAVNRSRTPFLLVTGHRPMYLEETGEDAGDYRVAQHMQASLEPLFLEHDVSLCLWGHIHSYDRSCPLARGECQDSEDAGIPHVTVGTAGADLDAGTFPARWSKAHINDFGYARVRASATALAFEFVLNRDGSVFDAFEIAAPRPASHSVA
jgi:hypothetical protein